jgi:predicted Rossmann-fold nucleotide-binding protein
MGNSDTTPSSAAPHPQAGARVLVYCASSQGVDPTFREAAGGLGRQRAGTGCAVVFGGGAFGPVGPIAAGALEAGS